MLFPPEYPHNPSAPLLSFGPAFAEAIARAVIAATCGPDEEYPHEAGVRSAAALTMLEAWHPRDQIEVMLAAQGVSAFMMTMDCFNKARMPGVKAAETAKYASAANGLMRSFSLVLHDMEKRHAKPLPPRPSAAAPVTPPPAPPPAAAPADGPDGGPENDPACDPLAEIRPDGTPASLKAYAIDPPEPPFVPREPAIMLALATRPKPWRMVNTPKPEEPQPAIMTEPPEIQATGLYGDRIPTGDALSRLASARLDPNAPTRPLVSEDDGALFELELVSTGGTEEGEAHKRAMMEEHPEGKPITVIRYGRRMPEKKE
jgi:hypothetical protein